MRKNGQAKAAPATNGNGHTPPRQFETLQAACVTAQERRTAAEVALHDAIEAEMTAAHALQVFTVAACRVVRIPV